MFFTAKWLGEKRRKGRRTTTPPKPPWPRALAASRDQKAGSRSLPPSHGCTSRSGDRSELCPRDGGPAVSQLLLISQHSSFQQARTPRPSLEGAGRPSPNTAILPVGAQPNKGFPVPGSLGTHGRQDPLPRLCVCPRLAGGQGQTPENRAWPKKARRQGPARPSPLQLSVKTHSSALRFCPPRGKSFRTALLYRAAWG